jgi:hypothetical protein
MWKECQKNILEGKKVGCKTKKKMVGDIENMNRMGVTWKLILTEAKDLHGSCSQWRKPALIFEYAALNIHILLLR